MGTLPASRGTGAWRVDEGPRSRCRRKAWTIIMKRHKSRSKDPWMAGLHIIFRRLSFRLTSSLTSVARSLTNQKCVTLQLLPSRLLASPRCRRSSIRSLSRSIVARSRGLPSMTAMPTAVRCVLDNPPHTPPFLFRRRRDPRREERHLF